MTRTERTGWLILAGATLWWLIMGAVVIHALTSPSIVQTIHNVRYHGMTCTETIDSAGNIYMNGCSR